MPKRRDECVENNHDVNNTQKISQKGKSLCRVSNGEGNIELSDRHSVCDKQEHNCHSYVNNSKYFEEHGE